MYYKQSIGILLMAKIALKSQPIMYQSKLWMIWKATVTATTCAYCASMNGRILSTNDPVINNIPVHPNCKCYVEALTAIAAGTVTQAGVNGVERYIAHYGKLPNNYMTQDEAKRHKWKKSQGNLAEVLPGVLIGGDIYSNWDQRLPVAEGRIWREADFDYVSGYRNSCRILYSNDGLLFVTYDHYLTFYEIGLENLR